MPASETSSKETKNNSPDALNGRCSLSSSETFLSKRDSLPNHLACKYCKRTHPRQDFRVRNGNAGYAFEGLCLMEAHGLDAGFCWRYIPRLWDYTARIESSEVDNGDQKLLKDRWISAYQPIYCHYCSQINLDENNKTSYQTRNKKCKACGSVNLLHLERHGPQRPLDSYANIRFVTRRVTEYSLEIRDLNGIRHPRRFPPKQSRIWRERCFASETLQAVLANECLLHLNIDRKLFSSYDPVVLYKPGVETHNDAE